MGESLSLDPEAIKARLDLEFSYQVKVWGNEVFSWRGGGWSFIEGFDVRGTMKAICKPSYNGFDIEIEVDERALNAKLEPTGDFLLDDVMRHRDQYGLLTFRELDICVAHGLNAKLLDTLRDVLRWGSTDYYGNDPEEEGGDHDPYQKALLDKGLIEIVPAGPNRGVCCKASDKAKALSLWYSQE